MDQRTILKGWVINYLMGGSDFSSHRARQVIITSTSIPWKEHSYYMYYCYHDYFYPLLVLLPRFNEPQGMQLKIRYCRNFAQAKSPIQGRGDNKIRYVLSSINFFLLFPHSMHIFPESTYFAPNIQRIYTTSIYTRYLAKTMTKKQVFCAIHTWWHHLTIS